MPPAAVQEALLLWIAWLCPCLAVLLLLPSLEPLSAPAFLPFMVGSSECLGLCTTLVGTGNSSAGRLFCRQLGLLPRAQLPSAFLLPCKDMFWSTLLLCRPAVPTGGNLTGKEMGNIFWRCMEREAGWIHGLAPSAPLGSERLMVPHAGITELLFSRLRQV